MALRDLALDVADGALDDRRPVAARMPLEPGEFVSSFGSETAGDFFLPFAEKIDRKAVLQFKARVASRPFIDTDEHQRRIQGQRHKSVRRQTIGIAVSILGRDDGHPGSEMPHHAAQFLGIDCHVLPIDVKLFQQVASAPSAVNASTIAIGWTTARRKC